MTDNSDSTSSEDENTRALAEYLEFFKSASRQDCEAEYERILADNDLSVMAWLGRNDLYFLFCYILRRPDGLIDWVFDCCREYEADPWGHLDLWAREHYKSSIITFAHTIQCIINDPEVTFGIFAHERGAAIAFLRQIKEEIETNVLLRTLYSDIFWESPRKDAPKWSEEDGIVVKRKGNPKEATVEAHGLIDGMPTGKHFSRRRYDDVVTEKMVTNPEMITKVTERWELSDNLGTRGGKVSVIGTRYHFADTYGVMIERKVYIERRKPATDDGTFDGNPLLFTVEEWEEKKRNQSPHIVAAQHLLNPAAGKEATFQLDWLKTWLVRPKTMNVYILVDPAKGPHASGAKTANTAMAVICIDAAGNKYLCDGYRHKMDLGERWVALRNLYRKWAKMPGVQCVFVGYEQFGMQTDLEYMEERMRIERVAFPIEELSWPREGPASKKARIERLVPDIRMGRFRIPAVIEVYDAGGFMAIKTADPAATREGRRAKDRGEEYLVAADIMRKNENERLYDVIAGFVEEYTFHPYATLQDMLDACSRIYDMEPTSPMIYNSENAPPGMLEPLAYMDT